MEARIGSVIGHLRRTALRHDHNRLTDGQLLDCFLARHEETAFETLVQRHGPMVLGVCQRVLHNAHDAEDAFQATFLVLVRKAASIVPRERVGNWLYGVAHRTALKAKGEAARRRAREQQVKDLPHREPGEALWWELRPLLDVELHRLPANYRAAVVLCDLEGKSRKEAARQLGWPEGTLSGRLARARGLLAKRLARRGLALSAGALAMALTERASAKVPATLAVFTVKAALLTAAGPAAAGVVPAPVAALTEGVLRAMMMTKFKAAAVVVLLLAGIGMGVGTLARHTWAADGPERGARASASSEPKPSLPAYVIEPPDVLLVEYAVPGSFMLGVGVNSDAGLTGSVGLQGGHLVRPDGSIGLGTLGDVMVSGLTVEQSKQAIARQLAKKLDHFQSSKLKVDVLAYNSKVYYVITDSPGPGEQVYRFPCTGTETVLFALAQVDGLPRVAGKKHVWIARRSDATGGTARILTVDWLAIIRDGQTATNYPLHPGDRVYVRDEAPMTTEVQEGKAGTAPRSPASAPRAVVPSTDSGMMQAEKDFKTAEFYRRCGQSGSALFYYEVVCRRYPDSPVAQKAAERLRELQKEAADPAEKDKVARVGQIIIMGNTKTKPSVILEQLSLFPGAELNYHDLQVAEEKLARLGLFVVDPQKGVRPTVTVVDAYGDSPFKDILVQVREKQEVALPASVNDIDLQLEAAFGKECPERDYDIKVQMRSNGMVLAAKEFVILKDGRVRLAPVSAAIFGKKNSDSKFPEINTIRANIAWLTFDRPIVHPADMGKHKILGFVVDPDEASPFKDFLMQIQEKAAASQKKGLGSDVAFLNVRSFLVPFSVGARNVKQLVLFASDDEGRTYRQAATATPQEKSFEFHAPRDGVFYFTVQALTEHGKEPADLTGAKPLVRVCVDTQAPTARLTSESLLTGKAIGWEVSDDNLDLSTLRIDYQVVGESEWRPLPAKPAATGEIEWQPPADVAVKVRLRVSDKAGNQADTSAILKPGKPE
jgi:RNA polymerase sigma factor (sigma-70 family)